MHQLVKSSITQRQWYAQETIALVFQFLNNDVDHVLDVVNIDQLTFNSVAFDILNVAVVTYINWLATLLHVDIPNYCFGGSDSANMDRTCY